MKKGFFTILIILLAYLAKAQAPDTLRLSVQDCIELALENNIPLKNSQLEIQKAHAVKNEARAEYFPKVSAQAFAFESANPLLTIGIENIDNALIRQTLYNFFANYGVNMGLKKSYSFAKDGTLFSAMAIEPVYAGGRIRNGNKLASLGIEAAEYQANIKADEVRLQVECLYWQIISLNEKIATLNLLDQLLDTLDKDLAGAINAGLMMPTDQYKVTLKKNENRLNRKKVEDGISLLRMALAQYIGIDWQTMILTDSIAEPTEPTAFYHDSKRAVAQRNESHLLDLSLQAESLKKKMTLGEALPTLLVGGSASYHTILDNTKPNVTAFAMLQVPITDWHKTGIKLKKHNLDTEIAENDRRNFIEMMELQTNQAWYNLQQSWLRISMAETALSDAKANLKITQDYYEAGLVTLSDLLETQTMLKLCYDELTDSRVDYQVNVINYKQLIGF